MASQGVGEGQGVRADLRRAVDRVGERYDERFVPPRSTVRPALLKGSFRSLDGSLRRGHRANAAPIGRMKVPDPFAAVFIFVPICA
ncbi:hypothetical protein OG866_39210 [Streptomyces sp. NBC_00663]|uniref:hypothetical protein n=1 Tax=Streptomyces sp. NBC_00663 TaxID=2975801 RepID=UPI002E329EAE|nr:hypothetical protein [Streptomyces sp. NBC_00663]